MDRVSEIDRAYHIMPEKGRFIDLTFEAPVLPPGVDRSLVLAATGYYEVHLDAEGPGDRELALRIASQPGAFGQWALGGLYREVEDAFAAAFSLSPP